MPDNDGLGRLGQELFDWRLKNKEGISYKF